MNRWAKIYSGAVFTFLYLPLAVIAAYSFNASKHSLAWKGFTLHWYAKLAGNSTLLLSAWHTIVIAVSAATLSCALGIIIAFALHRYRFKGRKRLFASLFIMMMSPDIVIGISLLIMFLALGAPLGFWTLLLAHVALCVPFTAAAIYTRFRSLDVNIIDAARDLGATEYKIFRHIVLPLGMPAVLAGWLLAFTMSLDDVIISFFTTGPSYEVLPLRIYSMVRLGVKPDVNALCVLMILLTVVAVFISRRLVREKR